MLAYLFWHRPRREVAVERYEEAQYAFHRSLAHQPPAGLRASWSFRVAELPWLASPAGEATASAGGGYEDWYLVDDYTALGVLGEAAVGRGHRAAHDRAAHSFAAGAGGLYSLEEGDPQALADASLAVWVGREPGSARPVLGELLSDGAESARSCLWKRQLVLGPAPEFCLIASESPAGVAASRLPHGWSAREIARETVVGW